MTVPAKRAYLRNCKLDSVIPSCEKACELTLKFFGEPTDIKFCDQVYQPWKEECQGRADGSNPFYMPTEEEFE